MHPDVKASGPGNCPVCGMPLVSLAALRKPVDYVLQLEQVPSAARAGETVRLRFSFFHPETGAPIKEFQVVHGMPFHLFVVSRDLEFYEHIHPGAQSDGSFTIETVLPDPTSSSSSSSSSSPLRRSRPKVADGIRFALTVEPPQPVAGRPTRLTYWLVDDRTGRPVTDLQPYLGAWGHALALRDDVTDFLHSHAPISPARSRIGRRAVLGWSSTSSSRSRVDTAYGRRFSATIASSRFRSPSPFPGWTDWPDGTAPPGRRSAAVRRRRSTGPRAMASRPDVYIGGDFTAVDGVRASHIARWDGRRWTALGEGVNGTVWAITVRGRRLRRGRVHVGRRTEREGYRAVGWAAVVRSERRNPRLPGRLRDPRRLCPGGAAAEVYAGGRFTDAGGIATDGVAMWNGRAWSALGGGVRTGIYDGVVRALALHGPDLSRAANSRSASRCA